jgi:bacterioferritin
MQGSPEIISLLNEVLTGELTAINQYFVHAKMLNNWGITKLAALVRAESIDEMKHADEIIDRILYLEGVPNLQRLGKVNVGETVKEQFEVDLQLECAALKRLSDGIGVCVEHKDYGSRALLERILVDEEHHADWLETQLEQVKLLGESAYIAEQL